MPSITSILTLADLRADEGPMASSAALCAREAHELHADGRDDAARTRALRSLSYSVGVFHADYVWAAS